MYLPLSSDVHKDEGYLEKHNVLTKQQINPYEHLYISIYAVNKVGYTDLYYHEVISLIIQKVSKFYKFHNIKKRKEKIALTYSLNLYNLTVTYKNFVLLSLHIHMYRCGIRLVGMAGRKKFKQ